MDPVTAAIIAAISAGITSGINDVAKIGVSDAYQALKALIKRRFGPQSSVVRAIQDLEARPDSSARKSVLAEELDSARAKNYQDILQAANILNNQLQSYNYYNQHNRGNSNFQQQGEKSTGAYGERNIVAGGNVVQGRPGLIVVTAVVLVAIFAFLLWQIIPFIRTGGVPTTPQPTATPVPTPEGTLSNFCLLVRANGSSIAYDKLYSDHLKQQVSPTQFNQEWSFINRPLSNCIGTITSKSGNSAQGTITVENASNRQNEVYNVSLVKDEYWKIDSLQKQQ